MSQLEFAVRCGIEPAYYGRIERGEINTTLKKCKQIADATGMTLADLFKDIV